MSDFDIGINFILPHEGGYSNVSGDTGGETYRGISRNNFPEWEGWAIVDQYKPLHNEQVIKDSDLERLVRKFYYINFWLPNDLQYINSDQIAKKLLDMCVNMGSHEAIELAQRALENFGISVNEDGKMGPVTYNAINSLEPTMFYNRLKVESVNFYKEVVQRHPQDSKFLQDWLERANE